MMISLLALLGAAYAAKDEDKVESLPMGITFKTNTYSGYLEIGGSTDK